MNTNDTFHEEFERFKKSLSSFHLFIKGNYRTKKIEVVLGITIISLFVLMPVSEYFEAMNIFTIPLGIIFVVALSVFIYSDFYRKNKILKKQGLPYSSFWKLKWETEELRDIRIHKIYEKYQTISIIALEVRIRIAQRIIDENNFNLVLYFEKAYGYILKNYILVIISVFIFLFKNDYSIENLSQLFQNIHTLLFIAFLIPLLWLIFKRVLAQSGKGKIDLLKDYIYVMENLILMKENMNK